MISSEGRLIPRNLKSTTKIIAKSKPQLPISRDITEEDTLIGFVKENNGRNDGFTQMNNTTIKYFFKYRSKNDTGIHNVLRVRRRSSENTTSIKNGTFGYSSVNNQKFIKKPIPKFSDIEYDEDFQDKVMKSSVRVADSNEQEDEDFNLNDYEFGVNHDEFAGRGKPVEPIEKVKEANGLVLQPQPILPATTNTKATDFKFQSNFHEATIDKTMSNKKGRAIAKDKRNSKMSKNIKEIDYYYDTSIKDVNKETKPHDSKDELTNENDDSKEFESKLWSVRTMRSLWNASNLKLKEKNSARVSKLLTILPLFPQVPYIRQLNSNVKNSILSKLI